MKMLPSKTSGMKCRGRGKKSFLLPFWDVGWPRNSTDARHMNRRKAYTFYFMCTWESPQENKAPKADGPKCLYTKLNKEQQLRKGNRGCVHRLLSAGLAPPAPGRRMLLSSWYRKSSFYMGVLSPTFQERKGRSECRSCICCFPNAFSSEVSLPQSGPFWAGTSCRPSPDPTPARTALQQYLGTFIHPSRCKPLLGSLVWRPGEFILSRQKASVKCVAYSAGRPQVAGKHVEHLG